MATTHDTDVVPYDDLSQLSAWYDRLADIYGCGPTHI
jgi:hypothetical protein